MRPSDIGLDLPAQLRAIHHRHHDIAYYQIDVVLFQHLQCLPAVVGCPYGVFVCKIFAHYGTEVSVVIYQQQGVARLRGSHGDGCRGDVYGSVIG